MTIKRKASIQQFSVFVFASFAMPALHAQAWQAGKRSRICAQILDCFAPNVTNFSTW